MRNLENHSSWGILLKLVSINSDVKVVNRRVYKTKTKDVLSSKKKLLTMINIILKDRKILWVISNCLFLFLKFIEYIVDIVYAIIAHGVNSLLIENKNIESASNA